MVPGMSEKKNTDSRSNDRKAIDDWMNGEGGKVLGGVLIIIVLWFVVTRFW
jgi:hypothetical protein